MSGYYEVYNDEYLMHHGIKGMHWGIRRYQPYPSEHKGGKEVGEASKAKDYTSKQRTRDKKIYGKRAEKRINKRMLKGEGVQSARHNEVVRKHRKEKTKKIAGTIATSALTIGGFATVYTLLKKKGANENLSKLLSTEAVTIGKSVVSAIFN